MCKYCCSVGDVDNDSQKDIMECSIQSFLDKLRFYISITPEKDLWLYASYENGEGSTISQTKIKYCPMCGRKL